MFLADSYNGPHSFNDSVLQAHLDSINEVAGSKVGGFFFPLFSKLQVCLFKVLGCFLNADGWCGKRILNKLQLVKTAGLQERILTGTLVSYRCV